MPVESNSIADANSAYTAWLWWIPRKSRAKATLRARSMSIIAMLRAATSKHVHTTAHMLCGVAPGRALLLASVILEHLAADRTKGQER